MNQGLAIFKKRQRLQKGVSTVSDEDYDRALDTQFERALRQRRFRPIRGPQFDPKYVPTFQDIGSGQTIFDPNYSSSDDPIYAQSGTGDVNPDPETGQRMFALPLGFQGRKLPENEEDLPPDLLKQLQDEYNRKVLPPQQDLERELRQNERLRKQFEQSQNKYLLVQRGTSDLGLEPGPLPPEKRRIGPKEAAGIYDPGPMPHITPEEARQEETDWQENIKSILGYTPNLTPEEQKQVRELNPKDWDDSTREKVGQASEMDEQGHQRGTTNVMQTTGNNQGLRLFMNMQKLRRPKGYAKGSSGIHIKPSHKGLFTAKAKGAGMGVQAYAAKVLSPNSSASAATRKQANFARNATKWNK